MKCKECGYERTCKHDDFVTADRFNRLKKDAIIECFCNHTSCEARKMFKIVSIKLKEVKE